MHFHDYVTKKLKHKSIVIDADDLQRDPGRSEMCYSVVDSGFLGQRANHQGGGASL